MIGESDENYVPDTPSFGIFFLLKQGEAEEDWVRLWSGAGDFAMPADSTDTSGGLYTGIGFPIGLPALSQVINGGFENLEFTLSGVDLTAERLAGVDRDEVDGSTIAIGIVDLDERQQPAGACDWLAELVAGKPRVRRSGRGEGALRSIILPASSALFDRHLAVMAHWTGVSQRARSATDAFCDLTARYSAESTVRWPV